MASANRTRGRRLTASMREEERVTPLELFFDLVFVLAITQCTALMADDPSWGGIAKGMILLALLWWGWVGYAWLTSVVDPEEGEVRLVIFAAMGALLIAALCVPEAFGEFGLEFALAYGFFRWGQNALFVLASEDDPDLRKSVLGLTIGTTVGVAVLVGSSFLEGNAQVVAWGVALALDMATPLAIDPAGWRLQHPEHFAERHGLIMIIALGESIVAIGVGAELGMDAGIATAALLGVALAAAMWWMYFDVVALVAGRRLAAVEEGRERNAMARDSYSYLHLLMIAGVVLVALGLKKTLGGVGKELEVVTAFALLGGVAAYLLGHVAFRWRNVHTVNKQRAGLAVVLLLLLPIAIELPALATLAIVTALMAAVIVYETISYGDARHRVRHEGTFPRAR